MDTALDRVFVRFSADKLQQLSGRITACLARLDEAQVWARGSDQENALGNIVLHLCGNLRQWIGSAVGGLPDIRVRDREFSSRGGIEPRELAARLESAVAEAAAIIAGLTETRLRDHVEVQGYRVTVLEAVYHVLEHFAQHTGQVLFATKMITHQDLGFYRHLSRQAHGEPVP